MQTHEPHGAQVQLLLPEIQLLYGAATIVVHLLLLVLLTVYVAKMADAVTKARYDLARGIAEAAVRNAPLVEERFARSATPETTRR